MSQEVTRNTPPRRLTSEEKKAMAFDALNIKLEQQSRTDGLSHAKRLEALTDRAAIHIDEKAGVIQRSKRMSRHKAK